MTPPPPVEWRNPRGVVVALIVGAAMWSCGCVALYWVIINWR